MKRCICIIGSGNVATHLAKAFRDKADVTMVSPRTLAGLPAKADVYILAVTDDAIPTVAQSLGEVNGIVVHTSGSTPMSALLPYAARPGVLYPLQTFSKEDTIDYSAIPVFVDCNDEDDLKTLMQTAELFTDKIYVADEETRRRLHIAAVFSCNFVNHLLAISSDILSKERLPLSILRPLIDKTIDKAFSLFNPALGQTGPAVRQDMSTIDKHLSMLESTPEVRNLYQTITQDIINYHSR